MGRKGCRRRRCSARCDILQDQNQRATEGHLVALLKLLEGTTVTLQAKPGSTHPAPTPSPGRLGDTYRETPTQRGFGGSLGSNQHDLGFGAKKGVRDGLPLHGGGGGGSSRFRRRRCISLLIPETRRSQRRDVQCRHVSQKEHDLTIQSTDSFHRSNILFILSGSFVGLEKIIGRRTGKGVSPCHT